MSLEALRQFDAFEAVRLEQAEEGWFQVAQLKRLLEGLPARQPGQVSWAVRGQQAPFDRKLLDLEVSAPVQLVCQRCLQPVEQVVSSRVLLHLVATEAELEEANEAEADPATDANLDLEPVVCRGRLDLLAEIEDELILALPYIALHEVCAEPLPSTAGEAVESDRRHPFADLAKLRDEVRQENEASNGSTDSSTDDAPSEPPRKPGGST